MKTKTFTTPKTNEQVTPKKAPIGCTIAVLIGIIGLAIYITYAIFFKSPEIPTKTDAYVITQELLKNKFNSSCKEISFPFSDYKHDYLNDSSYLIISHFTYKDYLGAQYQYNYKARVKWNGGRWTNANNWTLVYVEEFPQ